MRVSCFQIGLMIAFQSRDAAFAESERILREDVSTLQQKVGTLEDQLKKARAQSFMEAQKVVFQNYNQMIRVASKYIR
jgi:cyclopropane fatty-acyl-phospholipid synthase-like methyltransferase